jgi:SAM-dependent methyltransferase
MPASARRSVFDFVERRTNGEARARLLAQADIALESLSGKRVLEIGTGTSVDHLRRLQDSLHVAEAIGIDPASEPRDVGDRGRVQRGDARAMPFQDAYFDAAVSVSAFEHIHGLGEALAEAYRVLKPGGSLYAHFGPIWSSPYGHHLGFANGHESVSYHSLVLPSWCHLIDSREDVLRAFVALGVTEDLAERSVSYVFDSPEQNHLLFSDYRDLVNASDFEVLFFKGYDAPDLASKYRDAQQPRRLAKVAAAFPNEDVSQFLYDGIVMLLRRQSA